VSEGLGHKWEGEFGLPSQEETSAVRNAAGNYLFVGAIIVALVVWGFPASASDETISYQGVLKDDMGAPIEGLLSVIFRLYDAGSTQRWSEIQDVTFTEGAFSVQLGSVAPFPENLFSDYGELFLDVYIGGESFSPRVPLDAAPYALHAKTAGTTTGGASKIVHEFRVATGESVAAGDVVEFAGERIYPGSIPAARTFNAGTTSQPSATGLSSTEFVIAYTDSANSFYGTAVLATAAASDVSFGPENVFNSAYTAYIQAATLSATEVVLVYRDGGNSNYGTAVVGTVSGGAINFGTPTVFVSATLYDVAVAVTSATEFVVAYRDSGNSNYGTAAVGTISGGAISFGSPVVFNAASTLAISAAAPSASDVAIAYMDEGNSFYGTGILGSVSGGAISFGSETVFNPATTDWTSMTAMTAMEVVIAFRDAGNSYYGTAVRGVALASSLDYSAASVFNAGMTSHLSPTPLSATEFIIAYTDNGSSSFGTAVLGRLVGGVPVFYPERVFHANAVNGVAAVGLSSSEFGVAFYDGDVDLGLARIVNRLGIPDTMLFGIADEAAGSGQVVPVILHGISDHHTGLTAGDYYYRDLTGVTAIPSTERVGLAVSPTELLLDIER